MGDERGREGIVQNREFTKRERIILGECQKLENLQNRDVDEECPEVDFAGEGIVGISNTDGRKIENPFLSYLDRDISLNRLARLKFQQAIDGLEGLFRAKGIIVAMPSFWLTRYDQESEVDDVKYYRCSDIVCDGRNMQSGKVDIVDGENVAMEAVFEFILRSLEKRVQEQNNTTEALPFLVVCNTLDNVLRQNIRSEVREDLSNISRRAEDLLVDKLSHKSLVWQGIKAQLDDMIETLFYKYESYLSESESGAKKRQARSIIVGLFGAVNEILNDKPLLIDSIPVVKEEILDKLPVLLDLLKEQEIPLTVFYGEFKKFIKKENDR